MKSAMKESNMMVLGQAAREFYRFSPSRQKLIFVLMLTQSFTAGIGLLLIIPLLHIVGFDVRDGIQSDLPETTKSLFETLGLTPGLGQILLLYIVIVSAIACLRYWLAVNIAVIQQRYICFLRNRLYRRLLNSRWQFITQHKMSDFVHCLSGQVQAVGQASQLMLNFLSQLVLSTVMLGLAFLLSWQMSVLAVTLATILLVLLSPLNKKITRSGRRHLVKFKAIFQILTEQLNSLKMIKSYSSESYHADKLAEVSEKLEEQQIQMTRANALTQWVFMVGAVLAFSGFFYVSQRLFAVALPTTLLLLVVFSRLLPQLTLIQKTYQQLLHKVPAFHDVSDMMRNCSRAQENSENPPESMLLHQSIRLVDVTFGYSDVKDPIIQCLSIEIYKNSTVALVGPSGAGKSTLADLVAGLIEPGSGEIYCDNLRLDDAHRLSWRQNIAYVTQEVYLFHDTVRANLDWVSPEASDEELWTALKMAAADAFVAALPEKLDTVIGDRGVRLSGGERQRLALARAILARPQLLILDEATSALDEENENKIQTALRSLHGNMTIVIIAHRETTIAHADQRIVLGHEPSDKKPTPLTPASPHIAPVN